MLSNAGFSRDEMAWRVASDIPPGSCVNLGIGLPTRVGRFVDPRSAVIFHSENGLLGFASDDGADPDGMLKNVSNESVKLVPGGSIMSNCQSFELIRGGHIDLSVMGAFQVSAGGDLANWRTADSDVPSVGGAMDLAVGAKKIYVMMNHLTKRGGARLLRECVYPVTALGVVTRVYTDWAVLDVDHDPKVAGHGGNTFVVRELAPGVTEAELRAATDAPIRFDLEDRVGRSPSHGRNSE